MIEACHADLQQKLRFLLSNSGVRPFRYTCRYRVQAAAAYRIQLGSRGQNRASPMILKTTPLQTEGKRWCCPLDSPNQAKLRQGSDAVVQADFFDDLAVHDFEHGGPRKSHLPPGCSRQRTAQKIAESRASMRASALPATHYIVAFRDEIRGTSEV